jgi:hypothetical protein
VFGKQKFWHEEQTETKSELIAKNLSFCYKNFHDDGLKHRHLHFICGYSSPFTAMTNAESFTTLQETT